MTLSHVVVTRWAAVLNAPVQTYLDRSRLDTRKLFFSHAESGQQSEQSSGRSRDCKVNQQFQECIRPLMSKKIWTTDADQLASTSRNRSKYMSYLVICGDRQDNFLHTVSQKTGPLRLIWHNFTNSQHLLIIFVRERPYSTRINSIKSFLIGLEPAAWFP